MPKNPEIKKVLVLGSGPIVIGQAAEGLPFFKRRRDRSCPFKLQPGYHHDRQGHCRPCIH